MLMFCSNFVQADRGVGCWKKMGTVGTVKARHLKLQKLMIAGEEEGIKKGHTKSKSVLIPLATPLTNNLVHLLLPVWPMGLCCLTLLDITWQQFAWYAAK